MKDDGEVNRRKTWHRECLDPYQIITDQGYAARRVYERDRGVCCGCKTDLTALNRERTDIWHRRHQARTGRGDDERVRLDIIAAEQEWELLRHKMLGLGFKDRHLYPMNRLWECDHIRPVWMSEGKMEFFTLENLQTLCVPCHSVKTQREDMPERRAWLRIHPDLREPLTLDVDSGTSHGDGNKTTTH